MHQGYKTQTNKSKKIQVALRPNLSGFYIADSCVERLSFVMNSLQTRDYFHHLNDVHCLERSNQHLSVILQSG